MVEELDTSEPVVAGLAQDYLADVVREFVAEHPHRRGQVGAAPTLVVDAAACAFAVTWLEARCS